MHLESEILVTGGAGFLGSHLCERLLAVGAEVVCVDNFFTGSKRHIQHLLDHIHRLRERRKTIVIVEHDMSVVMNHCERIFVMDHGVKIAEGPPAEIQRDERVIDAYFGRRRR